MIPVSPVVEGLEEREIVLAKDQPQYLPLPVLLVDEPERPMVSRWRLDEKERIAISLGADILLTQLTFGNPFHPTRLEVD